MMAFRPTRRARTAALVVAVLLAGGMDPAQNLYREARDGFEDYEAGKFEAAAEHYATASELAPDDPRTAYNLAAARARQGRFDDADRLWQRVAEGTTGRLRADAFFNRGLAALSQNRLQEAADHFVETLLFDPKDEQARAWLTETLRRIAEQPPQPNPQGQQGDEGQQSDDRKKDQPSESPDGQPPPPRDEKGEKGEQDEAGESPSPDPSDGDAQSDDESRSEKGDDSTTGEGEQDRERGEGQDQAAAPEGAQAPSAEGGDGNREIAERALARLEENEREALRRALEQRAREAGAKRKGKGW